MGIESYTMYIKDEAGGVLLYMIWRMKLFLTISKVIINVDLNQSGVKLG